MTTLFIVQSGVFQVRFPAPRLYVHDLDVFPSFACLFGFQKALYPLSTNDNKKFVTFMSHNKWLAKLP